MPTDRSQEVAPGKATETAALGAGRPGWPPEEEATRGPRTGLSPGGGAPLPHRLGPGALGSRVVSLHPAPRGGDLACASEEQ